MALPSELLASVRTPDGVLDLRRRGEKDFLITIDGRVLMNSATHRSEVALAKLGCAGLRAVPHARVLISGLGMGFTLRAALDELGDDAEVMVAEINAVVAKWCEGPLAAATNSAVRDPRVQVDVIDVAVRIAEVARDPKKPRFDAIVLDMYEGPQTRVNANDPLYGPAAVQRVKKALKPKGTFAVWCEGPSPGFEHSLKVAGFRHELSRAGRGARIHFVYLAR